MRILDIIEATTVDGPGFRSAVYFAGCSHACPGCHNPQSHAFDSGTEVSVDDLAARLIASGLDVTLSGGDPAYQPVEAAALARRLHEAGLTVWLYTGFTFEELMKHPQRSELARAVDVVVDGPFIESLRDIHLQFRGSANQRLVDAPRSIAEGRIMEWHSDWQL